MLAAGDEVTFHVGGRAIRGQIFLPGTAPEKHLLFVHGLASSRSSYVDRASAASRELHAAALIFDLGGHGQSEGQLPDLSPADHLQELAAAYDFLLAATPPRTASETQVGVCGASYGGYLSALLPSVREVWRLLLRAPGLYSDALFDVPLGRSRRSEAVESKMLASVARHFTGRVLVVESQHDTVIPHGVIRQYLSEFGHAQHEVIAGAGHALEAPEHRAEFLQLILRWYR